MRLFQTVKLFVPVLKGLLPLLVRVSGTVFPQNIQCILYLLIVLIVRVNVSCQGIKLFPKFCCRILEISLSFLKGPKYRFAELSGTLNASCISFLIWLRPKYLMYNIEPQVFHAQKLHRQVFVSIPQLPAQIHHHISLSLLAMTLEHPEQQYTYCALIWQLPPCREFQRYRHLI